MRGAAATTVTAATTSGAVTTVCAVATASAVTNVSAVTTGSAVTTDSAVTAVTGFTGFIVDVEGADSDERVVVVDDVVRVDAARNSARSSDLQTRIAPIWTIL